LIRFLRIISKSILHESCTGVNVDIDSTILIDYEIDDILYHINPETNLIYDSEGNHVSTYDEDENQHIWTNSEYSQRHAYKLSKNAKNL